MPVSWMGLVIFAVVSLIGVIGLGLNAIRTGDLVPVVQVNKMQLIYEERLKREREIQEIVLADKNDAKEAQRRTAEQMSALIAEQRTTTEVVMALKRAAEMSASVSGWMGGGH